MRKKNYKAKTSMKCDGLQKYRCKLAKKWEINLMATTKKNQDQVAEPIESWGEICNTETCLHKY